MTSTRRDHPNATIHRMVWELMPDLYGYFAEVRPPCEDGRSTQTETQAAHIGITLLPAASASTRSARYCSALFRSAVSSMWL